MSLSGAGHREQQERPRRGKAGGCLGRFLGSVCLGALLGLVGCDEPTSDLRSAVALLAAENGEVAERAWERVEHHRRVALPYLEAALHQVAPAGRRNIIVALRRLALPESAALVGHVAAFDTDAQVRTEAYRTLESWASTTRQPGRPEVGPAARSALRQVDEVRSAP